MLGAVVSGPSVVLTDGRVLEGIDLRREGDLVLLTLPTGEIVTLPASAVQEIRLSGAPEPRPQAPSGLTAAAPTQLAGRPVEPPAPSEQLAVFGEPARWAPTPTDPVFPPSTWEMDPAQNNWNPSKWAKAPTDPNWVPQSAFDANKDVLAAGRSTWQKGATDPSWVPTDGFKKN
jgi:hypothetical protein